MKFKNQNYPVLIAPTHIPELNAVEETDSGITFGASVTLTTIEDTLEEAIERLPEDKTRIYVAIVEMLRWFAGRQVRSVAVSLCVEDLLESSTFITNRKIFC